VGTGISCTVFVGGGWLDYDVFGAVLVVLVCFVSKYEGDHKDRPYVGWVLWWYLAGLVFLLTLRL